MVPTVLDALGLEPPDADPRRHAVADPGRVVRARVRRRQGRDPPPHAVLRDDGPPRHLSRRLARGLPGAGAVVHGGGHGLRRDGHHRGQAARARREAAGSSTTSTRTSRRPRTSPPQHRDKLDRDDRALVRRGGQVQRAADRRRGTARLADERPQLARRSQPLRLLSAHVGGREQDRRRACSTAPHSITATVEDRERRRGRAGRRRAASTGGYSLLRQGSQAALRLQLPRRAAVPPRDRHDGPRRAARAALRVRADRQARPGARQGHAGARAALHRRQAGRPGRPADHHPARHRHHRGAHRAGATTARR